MFASLFSEKTSFEVMLCTKIKEIEKNSDG
jgi:hypothetical protein